MVRVDLFTAETGLRETCVCEVLSVLPIQTTYAPPERIEISFAECVVAPKTKNKRPFNKGLFAVGEGLAIPLNSLKTMVAKDGVAGSSSRGSGCRRIALVRDVNRAVLETYDEIASGWRMTEASMNREHVIEPPSAHVLWPITCSVPIRVSPKPFCLIMLRLSLATQASYVFRKQSKYHPTFCKCRSGPICAEPSLTTGGFNGKKTCVKHTLSGQCSTSAASESFSDPGLWHSESCSSAGTGGAGST